MRGSHGSTEPGHGPLLSILYPLWRADAAYLAWQIFRPPSEAEKAYVEKQNAEGDAAAAAAPAFISAAAEAPGAITTSSGLVYEEIAAGQGAFPDPSQTVKVGAREPCSPK